MPDFIEVDISELKLGKTKKVGELPTGDYEIQNSSLVTICSVEVPRAMRGKSEDEEEGEEEEAAAEGGEG